MNHNYTITFATYNQLDYTQQFIASLDREEVDFSRIVAVDNGSSDGTREWLGQQGFGAVILNDRNLSCGAAWNQGALAIQSEWTVVMNNDVVCAKGWLRDLLGAAEQQKLQIASPGMVEGALNYDLEAFTRNAQHTLQGHCRQGAAHAVCMAIHQDVWDRIGYFLPIPKLLGFEDALFFRQAQLHDVSMGITAASWLHHYGQTTHKARKLEKQLDNKRHLGDVHLMRFFMNQSWLSRKVQRYQRKKFERESRANELAAFGMTVHAMREAAEFRWI